MLRIENQHNPSRYLSQCCHQWSWTFPLSSLTPIMSSTVFIIVLQSTWFVEVSHMFSSSATLYITSFLSLVAFWTSTTTACRTFRTGTAATTAAATTTASTATTIKEATLEIAPSVLALRRGRRRKQRHSCSEAHKISSDDATSRTKQ